MAGAERILGVRVGSLEVQSRVVVEAVMASVGYVDWVVCGISEGVLGVHGI